MRNGLPYEVPGDKIYKNPEYVPGFFAERGLIVGSTNKINYSKSNGKKAYNFYDTIDLKVKTLDPKKIWTNREKQEDLDYQTNFVVGLKAWEKNVLIDYLPPKVEEKIDPKKQGAKKK